MNVNHFTYSLHVFVKVVAAGQNPVSNKLLSHDGEDEAQIVTQTQKLRWRWTENWSETIYLKAAQTRAGTTATNQEQELALPRKRSDGGVSLKSDLG